MRRKEIINVTNVVDYDTRAEQIANSFKFTSYICSISERKKYASYSAYYPFL